MATITQIEIDGFKAFPANFTLNLGTGKNLLLYGENGSGKSSLYYALHALLQSVFKDDKGAKYFTPGSIVNGNFTPENENLINIHRYDEAKDNTYAPYIRITFEDGKIWRLDNRGLLSENGGDESEIRILNKNSAFINHSYISRFHAARNSEEMDLWNVFYKDILPFHIPAGTSIFLADLYDDIVRDYNAGIGMEDVNIQDKITAFNKLLNNSINRINTKVTSIYNDNFKNEDERALEIKLIYYSDDDQDNTLKEHFYLYYGNNRNGQDVKSANLYTSKIGIEIKEDGFLVYKPQSYFNEAKLTAIALSVRFAAMTATAITPGSFFALDDMLISLDMSNRMKVIKYLLDEIAPKYKLYVFTHDRLLFASFKKRIFSKKEQGAWLCGGIYMHDRDNSTDFNKCTPYPVFIEEKDAELKAREYYIMHDYPACGQQLRKWCEDILSNLYPDTLLRKRDPRTGKTVDTSLNDRIVCLSDYCKKEFIDFQKQAATNFVEIIPEIDIPAHSLAFTHYKPEIGSKEYGMDHLDLFKPETYQFADDLFKEYLKGDDPVFVGKRVHIGTDEYSNAKKEVVEKFRAFTDHYIRLVEGFGKQAVIWGALTHAKGDTPVKSENIIMNAWYNGYADPATMIKDGYQLISIPDAMVYIVPLAGYYQDYLNEVFLYKEWTPAHIGKAVFEEKHPAILGGMFAIWNDHAGNGISVKDIHHRVFPALQTLAVKTWTGKETSLPFEVYNEKRSAISEAPGVNQLGRIGKSPALVYERSTVAPGSTSTYPEIGYNYTVSFDITGAPEKSGTELFRSPNAVFYLADPIRGMMGFARDGYLNTFPYKVNPGEKATIQIEGDHRSTTLRVNGKVVEEMNIQKCYFNAGKDSMSYIRTLVFPLEKAGNFNSRIENLKVHNYRVSK